MLEIEKKTRSKKEKVITFHGVKTGKFVWWNSFFSSVGIRKLKFHLPYKNNWYNNIHVRFNFGGFYSILDYLQTKFLKNWFFWCLKNHFWKCVLIIWIHQEIIYQYNDLYVVLKFIKSRLIYLFSITAKT